MKLHHCVLTLTILLCSCVSPALGEEVTEVWRSPFGVPRSVSVNHTDGSCWAATGASVMHLAADGEILSQTNGFSLPASLSVNSADGSCWVADSALGQIVHLAADGSELWRGDGYLNPSSVSANSDDGSCWVADLGNDQVVHLASNGSELWRGGWLSRPSAVSVNPTDGSCWVADPGHDSLVHVAEDGSEIWRDGTFSEPIGVSANPVLGSCWVIDEHSQELIYVDEDGTELWSGTYSLPKSVSVDPSDASCWVAYGWSIAHVADDGTQLLSQGGPYWGPWAVAVDPTDGSCWVADQSNAEVVHLAEDGSTLPGGGKAFNHPRGVSVNAADASCWATDTLNHGLVHLPEDGAEPWRHTFAEDNYPNPLSVNSSDGSCWVVALDDMWDVTVKFAADGTELWRKHDIWDVGAVSVNSADGSCWMTDEGSGGLVVRLRDDGVRLLEHPAGTFFEAASVDATDGSCWLAGGEVLHLSEDGTELWRSTAFGYSYSISVSPTDSACWLADTANDAIVRLAEDGTELWRGLGFAGPQSVSANLSDGSCWVADTGHGEVVHLAPDGAELWRGGGFSAPESVSVNPADNSCWVADWGNSQIAHLAITAYELNLDGVHGDIAVNGTVHELPYALMADVGATVAVEALPHPFYEFTAWSGDLAGAENPTIVIMDSDKSVTANFAIIQHVLSLTGVGDGSVEVDGVSHSLPWSGPLDAGTTVLLEAVPDDCWMFEDWLGDLTGDVNPVSVEILGDLSIVANFVSAERFGDVECGQWAIREVAACCDAGIVSGYPDGFYHPELAVTRDQMAVYISRALAGGDENVPEFTDTPTFPDVGSEHWALDYVEYAVSQNVVAGYQDGNYHPEYDVTRDQMAVYIARALVAPEGEAGLADYVPADPRDFPDVAADFWAYTHVEYCVENGVVAGYLDGLYHPELVVTRDQMAVYVARAFGLLP